MADGLPRQLIRLTRPPVKRTRIERMLRQRIINGQLAPGSVLPSRWALCKTFKASIHTVQRAVNRLVEDEFLVSRAGEGTYVAPTPPHLSQMALVIPHNPSDGYAVWSRFWQALTAEAARIGRETPRRVLPFLGVYGPTDSEDYQRLVNLLSRQRLAGLIFAAAPQWLPSSSILEFDIPRVAIMSREQYGTPAVAPDIKSFISRAVDHFARRGRKRLAAIFTESGANQMSADLCAAARARGMTIEPYWIQAVGLVDVNWARNTAQLLFNSNQRQRPDALLLGDDNIVTSAAEGVRAAGVRVGEDLDIVAHCNFPLPPESAVPVTRLGFDTRQLLDLCIASIDAQRRGITPRNQTFVPAVFQEEVSALQSLN
jgi:DNA-binding LacI/PurR family transcriptional regulator